jgi:hypothetical protein
MPSEREIAMPDHRDDIIDPKAGSAVGVLVLGVALGLLLAAVVAVTKTR